LKTYPQLGIGVPNITREIKSLSEPIILGKELPGKASTVDVHVMVKEYQGKLYIFACNVTNKPIKAEITLPRAVSGLKVISEEREIDMDGKKFSDNFIGYDTHIYTDNADFADAISLPKVKAEILDAKGDYEFKY